MGRFGDGVGVSADLALVFVSGGTPEQAAAAGERACALTGATATLGCSAGGVIVGGQGIEGHAAVSAWVGALLLADTHSFPLDGFVSRAAVGVLMGGTSARPLVSQGCRPVGPAMTVTAASGNLLSGLAGVPALDKLRQVVAELPPPDQALATRGLHLGIAADAADAAHDGDLVRQGLAADAVAGFFADGEIGPVAGRSHLHGFTASVLVFP